MSHKTIIICYFSRTLPKCQVKYLLFFLPRRRRVLEIFLPPL